ncbi:uncharacterized protein LOC101158029 [Oryzias latipes]|uniref:Apolipoprotein M n=1 Tax=Oryzias latipes TaxID=8090 RepID=H2M1H5_ORYLA|nr:uncharacterized protein LOC101158029 [Oryzias latipes]
MNQRQKVSVEGRAASSLRPTMALLVAVLLLAVVPLCAASAPDCDELVKPFMPEDSKLVFGKWVYVMGAGDPLHYHDALGSLRNSWIDLSPTSNDQVVILRWGDYCFNRCIFGEVNATVTGIATTFQKNLSDHKGHILQTCPDCLLWTDTFRNRDVTGRYILLFSRTGKIDPEHVDILKKQAECLNFPVNFHRADASAELCPDDKDKTE